MMMVCPHRNVGVFLFMIFRQIGLSLCQLIERFGFKT